MVNGKPGTGETPIEKLLSGVMSSWYLASIIGVIWAHTTHISIARQAAIIGPFIYHFRSTMLGFLPGDLSTTFNQDKLSKNKLFKFHGVLAVACIMIYLNA